MYSLSGAIHGSPATALSNIALAFAFGASHIATLRWYSLIWAKYFLPCSEPRKPTVSCGSGVPNDSSAGSA